MKNNIENLEKTSFDPDAPGVANGNFFGLPCGEQEADTVIVQVPWDATVSYGKGTADGPRAMLDASLQVDLFDERFPQAADMKVWTLPEEQRLRELNAYAGERAGRVIAALEAGEDPALQEGLCAEVNLASEELNAYVEAVSEKYLSESKSVVLAGGEHSVPLGLIKALSRRYPGMGILHIDAHSDTRNAYEGFKYSHASIMYNAAAEAEGETWKDICLDIVSSLPQNVYVSFDIDGLTPEYCPGTGTPVPGGLTFSQVDYLLYILACSGKRIVGADLCEVAPGNVGEWDANTGSRVLFKLLLCMEYSRKKK